MRFFSADAANLYLISLIAPARKETHVERPVKLDLARAEVQNGMLVTRQMTEEERRRNLARITPPKRPGDDTDG